MATGYVETASRSKRTEADAREEKATALEHDIDVFREAYAKCITFGAQNDIGALINEMEQWVEIFRNHNAALFGKVTGR